MKRKALLLSALMAAMMLTGCRQPQVGPRVRAGIGQFQAGRFDRAKKTLTQVLAEEPSNPAALFYLGRVHHAQGFYEQAVYYYQCCLDAAPRYRFVDQYLAKAQAQAGHAGPKLRFIPEVYEKD